MIKVTVNETLTFEISGQDAERFLSVCKEKNIAPEQAFKMFVKEFIQSYYTENNDINEDVLL